MKGARTSFKKKDEFSGKKPSVSPIRKQLVKQMIQYCDALQRARSNSRTLVEECQQPLDYSQKMNPRRRLVELKAMMKSELNKLQNNQQIQSLTSQKVFDSIKGYPSFMSPSKKNSPEKLQEKFSEEFEFPWNQLKARIESLEDEPVTDESEIMRELDQTIQSIIEEAELAENQPDYILDGELRVYSRPDLEREGEAEDVGYATPSKRLKSTLSKSIKLIVEKKLAEKLVPIQDESQPKNKTEREQKEFHTRKSKEVRKLQYVSSLSRDLSSRRSRNKLASQQAGTNSSQKKVEQRSGQKNLFNSNSKKLFSLEETDQQKFDAVKKRSHSRNQKYVDYIKSQPEKSNQASSRNSHRKIDYIKVASSNDGIGTSSKAFESFNSNHKSSKKPAIRDKISKLANQLSQNPSMPKQEKLGIIYELENLLNQELEEMEVGKSQLMRTDPQEQHPIWIRHHDVIYPAMLRCSNGFKVNQKDVDLLEIREGDVVTVEINETQNTQQKKESRWAAQNLPFKLCGMIRKPLNSEISATVDFVVDDGQGQTYPAIIYLREGDSYDYVEAPRSNYPHAHATPNSSKDVQRKEENDADGVKDESLLEFQEFEQRLQAPEDALENHQNSSVTKNVTGTVQPPVAQEILPLHQERSAVQSSKSIISVERVQLNKIYSILDDGSLQQTVVPAEKDSAYSERHHLQDSLKDGLNSEAANHSIEYASISERSKIYQDPHHHQNLCEDDVEPKIIHIVEEDSDKNHTYPNTVYSEVFEIKEQHLGQIISKEPHRVDDNRSVAEEGKSVHSDQQFIASDGVVKFHQNTKNCRLFDPFSLEQKEDAVIVNRLDRSDSQIGDLGFTTKAIFVNGENQTSFVLLRLPMHLARTNVKMSIKFSFNQDQPEYLSVKFVGSTAYQSFKIQDVQSQAIMLAGGIAKVITLEEKDESKLPSLIYFIDGVEFLGQSNLLQDQRVEIVTETGERIFGRIVVPELYSSSRQINPDAESSEAFEREQEELEFIQSAIDEVHPDVDFIIVKLDSSQDVLNLDQGIKSRINNGYRIVLMDGAGQTADDDEEMRNIMLQLMPNPMDPEMIEEDSGRILISDEVLMTQILCKIKDLIREDIQQREKIDAVFDKSIRVKNSKDAEKNQRSQSRVLSPKRIERIQAAEEEVEIQDFSAIEVHRKDDQIVKGLKETSEIDREPKNGMGEGVSQTQIVDLHAQNNFTVEHQSLDEEYDLDYIEAKKENLWDRLRRLMKKKHSLLEKKQKNVEIIEAEVTKIEIRKEQTSIEKKLLEDQRKIQMERFTGKPHLIQSAVEVFERQETKLEEKEHKILEKESKLIEIVQEITQETDLKLQNVEVEIVEVEDELAKIDDIQRSQFGIQKSLSESQGSFKPRSEISSKRGQSIAISDQDVIPDPIRNLPSTQPVPIFETSEVYLSVHRTHNDPSQQTEIEKHAIQRQEINQSKVLNGQKSDSSKQETKQETLTESQELPGRDRAAARYYNPFAAKVMYQDLDQQRQSQKSIDSKQKDGEDSHSRSKKDVEFQGRSDQDNSDQDDDQDDDSNGGRDDDAGKATNRSVMAIRIELEQDQHSRHSERANTSIKNSQIAAKTISEKDHQTPEQNASKKSSSVEKKIQQYKELFRQELSETKSKILENLGASESSESENEYTQSNRVPTNAEKSLASDKFSKKKEINMVYVSPDSSEAEEQKKEDSMILSSSSSKKVDEIAKSTSKKQSVTSQKERESFSSSSQGEDYFKHLRDQISQIDIQQDFVDQTDAEIERKISETKPPDLPQEVEISQKSVEKSQLRTQHQEVAQEISDQEFKTMRLFGGQVVRLRKAEQIKKKDDEQTTLQREGKQITEIQQVKSIPKLQNGAALTHSMREEVQEVVVNRNTNSEVRIPQASSYKSTKLSIQNNVDKSSQLSVRDLKKQDTSDSEIEVELKKLNASKSSDCDSEDDRFESVRNHALEEAKSFISNNIKKDARSTKTENLKNQKHSKATKPKKVVRINSEQAEKEEEEQGTLREKEEAKTEHFSRDRGETDLFKFGDFVGIGQVYRAPFQTQSIEETQKQIDEQKNAKSHQQSEKKTTKEPKKTNLLRPVNATMVESFIETSQHLVQIQPQTRNEVEPHNSDEYNAMMTKSLLQGSSLHSSIQEKKASKIEPNTSRNFSEAEPQAIQPDERSSRSKINQNSHIGKSQATHKISQTKHLSESQVASDKKSRVNKAPVQGQEEVEEHYSRISINLNINEDQEVEFQGYGKVTLRNNSGHNSPEKSFAKNTNRTQRTGFTSNIFSPEKVTNFDSAHSRPVKPHQYQSSFMGERKSRLIREVQTRAFWRFKKIQEVNRLQRKASQGIDCDKKTFDRFMSFYQSLPSGTDKNKAFAIFLKMTEEICRGNQFQIFN